MKVILRVKNIKHKIQNTNILVNYYYVESEPSLHVLLNHCLKKGIEFLLLHDLPCLCILYIVWRGRKNNNITKENWCCPPGCVACVWESKKNEDRREKERGRAIEMFLVVKAHMKMCVKIRVCITQSNFRVI